MNKYEEYRDSGVEWLGMLPIAWGFTRLKNTVNDILGGGTPVTTMNTYWTKDKDKGYLWVSISDITKSSFIIDTKRYITKEGFKNSNASLVPAYSILYSIYASLGKVAYAKSVVTTNQAILSIDFNQKQILYKFGFYFLGSLEAYIPIMGMSTTQNNISLKVVENLYVPVPSIAIQKNITNYLDYNVDIVDNLILTKKKQVYLLQEQKQATINKVVIKGLNSDVELKDTNIEYIGKIPKHWDVTKVKYIGILKNGINIGREAFGTGFPFVSYKDVYDNRVLKQKASGLIESTPQDRILYSIQAGDLLFTRTSETIGELGLVSLCSETIDNAVFAGFLIRLRLFNDTKNSKYLSYFFNAQFNRNFYLKNFNLVTRASLSQELLNIFPVILPPLEEQEIITQYLDNYTTMIDQTIEQINKSIELLEEYRTSLISHVVTGKIKV